MRPLRSFRSVPRLPSELEGLQTLSRNLWWHWNHTARELFRNLNPPLWVETNHNPVAMLGRLSRREFEDAAQDDALRFRLQREVDAFQEYLERTAWFTRAHARDTTQPLVAYFCAEYALAESFRIYSGGLGVLAGDHLKAASDLGVPLVAIGLFYERGYFQQRLSLDGWQIEGYPYNDPTQLPMEPVKKPDGSRHLIEVLIGGERTSVQIWKVQVGRISLYLLDTNLPENPPHLRTITDRLYGGDDNHRLSQEIILGIGGVRLLASLGIEPEVYHMNEGHAALLTVERIRRFVEQGLPLSGAIEAARAANVFTTHTPIPAGNKVYPNDLLEYHLRPYLNEIGLSMKQFLEFGQIQASQGGFGTTVFALRFASYANGVSELHGRVSREMWQPVWGDITPDEAPIHHITNGTHVTTWVSGEMADLYDTYLGPRWREEPHNAETWERIDDIPAAELWRAHERSRERLISVARRRLVRQLEASHASPTDVQTAAEVLDFETLTIGFARRVATYKRLLLMLHDPDRLTALLTNPDHPVQMLVAGKAHPDDQAGKELIQRLIEMARGSALRNHIVFLENYDMFLGHLLTSGVDVWLNTPRRRQEASGTSGMKAALNGVLNFSVLDGWWDKAYTDAREAGLEVGWAIGTKETESMPDEEADRIDANVLYTLLEREVVPAFYDRSSEGVPREWVRRMKTSIRALAPVYNTHRMLHQYVEEAYLPVAEHRAHLAEDGWKRAIDLGAWKERVTRLWPKVTIQNVETEAGDVVVAGTPVETRVGVRLAGMKPNEVRVQVAVGRLDLADPMAPLAEVAYTDLAYNEDRSTEETAIFEGAFTSDLSGHLGVTVRVLPFHPDLTTPVEMGLVHWA